MLKNFRTIGTKRGDARFALHRVHGAARILAAPEPVSRWHDPAVAACADLAPDIPAQQTPDASVLLALYNFWVSQNAGLTPFAFYNPFDVASGQQIGSNYDPTGNNTQGRVTVVFRGNWAQATDVARTNVQGLELVEVA